MERRILRFFIAASTSVIDYIFRAITKRPTNN